MPTIAISGRRFGKTAAAAQAAGMSIDSYRELMRQQHEHLEAARARHAAAQPLREWRITRQGFMVWPDDDSAIEREFLAFLKDYTVTFEEPVSTPIIITIPGRDDWLRRWMTGSR